MDRLGLDTSVIIRLLTGQPEHLAQEAFQFVQAEYQAGRTLLISDLVISETYFALNYHYDIPKPAARNAILALLESGMVIMEPRGVALEILGQIEKRPAKPGLVDLMIHAQYRKNKAGLVTFEKAAIRLDGALVLGQKKQTQP